MKDLVLLNEGIVIPKLLRQEIIGKLHYGHMGVDKTVNKAREVLFWPGYINEIKTKIQSCATCQKFQNSNPNEPLINRKLPSRPWEAIAADFFYFDEKEYLLIVDLYSKFPEIVNCKNNATSQTVIKVLKELFSRHGIPDTFYSDGGSQFSSYEFQHFMKHWEIEHTISSPRNPHSNGFIERQVQTIKKLMKKATDDKKDTELVLLE
ncbi:Integrase core domain [Popillia japonica]|uniref:RNA-directed DNA polymerase n=1 Tax=Popillia japonica TaxID=7064 RepID=A0AAW1HTX6_POPJA